MNHKVVPPDTIPFSQPSPEGETRDAARPAEPPRDDFALLLDEVRAASSEDASSRLSGWTDRFAALWGRDSDQWDKLVELLPVAQVNYRPTAATFPTLLLPPGRAASACDMFILSPVVAARLNDFVWTDKFGSKAVRFVAGCTNLAQLARAAAPSPVSVRPDLGAIASSHVLTLLPLTLHHSDLLSVSGAGCTITGVLSIPTGSAARSRFETQFAEAEGHELRALVEEFGHERVLKTIRTILDLTQTPTATLVRLITAALDQTNNAKCHALVEAFAFENAEISATLRERFLRESGYKRSETLRMWARYAAREDAFTFCWECIKPAEHQKHSPPFGDSHEARLKVLQELLAIPARLDGPHDRHAPIGWSWRATALRTFAAIASLVEMRSGDQEEHWVRQEEAVQVLTVCPELVPCVVRGILNECQAHWNALDPIVLGLPPELTIPVLSEFVAQSPVWADSRHHARRLFAHARGEAVPGPQEHGRGELLSAAESLIRATRTRTSPVSAQTWLAEAGIERLWHGALEAAQADVNHYLTAEYGQDEHEHCAILADTLARELSATNTAVQGWLKVTGVRPALIRAAVRRIPRRSKGGRVQEGGTRGVQADLAFLLRCDVGGKCTARRVTLVQAKKLPVRGGSVWPGECRLQPRERTQLNRLLEVSSSAHYLFMLPCELGQTLSFLPAPLVRDILKGRRPSGGVPVPMILQAGVRLSDFVLLHVIGLWTGDDDKDLLKHVESGADVLQGPRIVIDITVSQEGEVRAQ